MNEEYLYKLLQAPHMSEKGTRVSSKHGQYTFMVLPQATKKDIKKAVEVIFDVKVNGVRIVNIKKRKKQGIRGNRKGGYKKVKKAYVSLAEGGHIDFFGEQGV